MADPDQLLQRAMPRLGRGDEAAAKLRRKLCALARATCKGGPEKAKKRGLSLDARRLERLAGLEDDDELLSELLARAGEAEFLRLFKRLGQDLTAALKKKREAGAERSASSRRSGASGRTRQARPSERTRAASSRTRAPSERVKAASSRSRPASERVQKKRASSQGLRPISSDELEVPSDALDVPAEEPSLELAAEPEIRLASDEAPLQVRMDGDDAPARDAEDKDARSAADRALERWRRSGDPEELETARRLFKQAAAEGEGKLAKGAARAGLALTLLLSGEEEKALAQAEKALALFPQEPTAVEVLLRARREGEGAREQVRAALLRGARAFASSDLAAIDAAAGELSRLAPQEPFGPLLALARLVEEGVGPDALEPALLEAWKAYPGSALGDLPLGGPVDVAIARAALRWVKEEVERRGPEALSATIKNVESKENVVAGAIQLALGLARVALATRKTDAAEEQTLRMLVGQALFSAQYYDQAKEVLAAARTLDRNHPQVLDINALETQCGVMRRAFDKPGVKAKMGKFDGVGIVHYRKALAARLQRVLAERDAEQARVEGDQMRIVQAVIDDPKRRERIAARAKKAELPDPFSRLAELEAQLGDLDDQARDAAAPAPRAEAGGMFSRMKQGLSKAVDKAKSAAKGAELALRKSVAMGKKSEAVRALARSLRERPEDGWGDPELDRFLEGFDAVDARLEVLEAEAQELRSRVAKASAERIP